MNNLLFIEGPIQTGKSTLIRTCLGEHLAQCGGFTSQRLIDASGKTRGFRLAPVEAPLTALAEKFEPDTGIFKWFEDDSRVITDQSVFDTVGVQLLSSSADRPLILLDEIGGSELLCDDFRKVLDAVFSSDKPCLGVLKLADGAQRLQSQYQSGGPTIAEYNALLRHAITSDDRGRLLYFEREAGDASEVERQVSEFVKSIFD